MKKIKREKITESKEYYLENNSNPSENVNGGGTF